jgi:hypothetical protein
VHEFWRRAAARRRQIQLVSVFIEVKIPVFRQLIADIPVLDAAAIVHFQRELTPPAYVVQMLRN